MSARVTTAEQAHPRPLGRGELLIALYALAGGVGWWFLHLCALTALAPMSCEHGGWAWTMTAVNVVSILGVISALLASFVLRRLHVPGSDENGWPQFMGLLAIVFNLASLAVTVLESVPVYVLDSCR